MPEAPLENKGSGLAPAGEGWYVVNVRDAQWLTSAGGEKRPTGSECPFESGKAEFPQFGFRLHVLEPGESNGLYHGENQQEDFLVLSGECLLLVEGEERRLRAWDFVHSPGVDGAHLRRRRRRAVRDPDGRREVDALGGALSGLRVRRAIRRERRAGDVEPRRGVRRLRAVAAGAALVLGPAALGLAD